MLSKIKKYIQPQSLIFMYHRIANPGCDPWELSVSPENFEQHLQVLSRKKMVRSLKAIYDNHQKRNISLKKYAAITFDDGYVDNYMTAKPLLEKYRLPATFFIAHQHINMNKEYWWDELEKICLNHKDLPERLEIDINGEIFRYDTDPNKISEQVFIFFPEAMSRIPNIDLYIKLWKRIQPLAWPEQQKVIAKLRVWAGVQNNARKEYCCMNSSQLLELSANGDFEIGAHTFSHPALAFHSKEMQENEIKGNKEWLEQLTKRRIRFCAYPYGNFNDASTQILKELNFDAGLSTRPEIILKKTARYEWGRFQVNNWNGAEFETHLNNWMKGYKF